MERKEMRLAWVVEVMLMMWLVSITPSLGCSSVPKQNGCKDCISDQMKYACPACVPLLRCMAKCLWGGTTQVKCVKKCDCNGGKPRLSDCKKCMGRCKCSCAYGGKPRPYE